MKNILISYFLLNVPLVVFSQVSIYEIDIEPCIGGSNLWDLRYRWNYIEDFVQIEDTVILYFGAKEDCIFNDSECVNFNVKERSGALFIDYEWFNGYTDENGVVYEGCPSTCRCYFFISMKIAVESKINKIIYEGEDLTQRRSQYKPIQSNAYELYGKDTINYIDRFGIKRGVWIKFGKDSIKRKEVIIYEDQESGIETISSEEGKSYTEIFWYKGIPVRITSYKEGNISDESYLARKSIDKIILKRSESGILKEIIAYREVEPKVEIIK